VRGVAPPRLRTAQAGISLVETLVALVLGLAMVSVAFNLYVSNRAVFRQIDAMVGLQESASVGVALLETNLRHAGGTLCRNGPPTTVLATGATNEPAYRNHNPKTPARYWEVPPVTNQDSIFGLMGWHAYQSTINDPIVSNTVRLAGDSISIMSDNMGAVARVTGPATHTSSPGTGGFTGSYTFPVDNGTNFPVGTVAMACDYARAVVFQVTESAASSIKLHAGTGAPSVSPGNCAVTMRLSGSTTVQGMAAGYNCSNGKPEAQTGGAMYTFGPGSMIGEHSFSHWYIGRKTGTTDGLSLFRKRMVYASGAIGLGDAEEIVPDVVDMRITILRTTAGYPATNSYETVTKLNRDLPTVTFRFLAAARIELTLKSQEKVGLAAQDKASAVTYTIPINVAIRARMPGVVRR
jgi:hypothetical protein